MLSRLIESQPKATGAMPNVSIDCLFVEIDWRTNPQKEYAPPSELMPHSAAAKETNASRKCAEACSNAQSRRIFRWISRDSLAFC